MGRDTEKESGGAGRRWLPPATKRNGKRCGQSGCKSAEIYLYLCCAKNEEIDSFSYPFSTVHLEATALTRLLQVSLLGRRGFCLLLGTACPAPSKIAAYPPRHACSARTPPGTTPTLPRPPNRTTSSRSAPYLFGTATQGWRRRKQEKYDENAGPRSLFTSNTDRANLPARRISPTSRPTSTYPTHGRPLLARQRRADVRASAAPRGLDRPVGRRVQEVLFRAAVDGHVAMGHAHRGRARGRHPCCAHRAPLRCAS